MPIDAVTARALGSGRVHTVELVFARKRTQLPLKYRLFTHVISFPCSRDILFLRASAYRLASACALADAVTTQALESGQAPTVQLMFAQKRTQLPLKSRFMFVVPCSLVSRDLVFSGSLSTQGKRMPFNQHFHADRRSYRSSPGFRTSACRSACVCAQAYAVTAQVPAVFTCYLVSVFS